MMIQISILFFFFFIFKSIVIEDNAFFSEEVLHLMERRGGDGRGEGWKSVCVCVFFGFQLIFFSNSC